jgi:thioredoxin-related protein
MISGGVFAQGINFEQNLSWLQIEEKAKTENKYIFVDCFATWCGPCKMMDRDVYTKENVSSFVNAHFISVKVQMDTTKSDAEAIKKWYADACGLKHDYKVNAFPTYLFFSPIGEIVHRAMGAMPDTLFLKIASNALKPEKQYYNSLQSFKDGKRDYEGMPYLADAAKSVQEQNLANDIAKEYISGYLNNLNEKIFFTKANLEFIQSFLSVLTSKDRSFQFIYKGQEKADKIVGLNGCASYIIYNTISNEEINTVLWNKEKAAPETPNWSQLTNNISKKYRKDIAEKVILGAQLRWYNEKKQWPEIVKYNIKKVEKYGLDTAGMGKVYANNMIWDVIFRHATKKEDLEKGIKWMKVILEADSTDGPNIDTYANLLYKAGRKKEAIGWEEKAIAFTSEKKGKEKTEMMITFYDDQLKEFMRTLAKMKNDERTWDIK